MHNSCIPKHSSSLAEIIVGRHFTEGELFIAFKTENPVVMFPESGTVTHCDESYTNLLEVFVHMLLHVKGYLTSALVQDGISGSVVNKSSHGNSLLFSSRKDVIPIIFGIPASFTSA
jgi:hypothetical protein